MSDRYSAIHCRHTGHSSYSEIKNECPEYDECQDSEAEEDVEEEESSENDENVKNQKDVIRVINVNYGYRPKLHRNYAPRQIEYQGDKTIAPHLRITEGGSECPEIKPDKPELCECYFCDYTTTNRSDFTKHLKIHANQTKRYRCSLCGYQTAWRFSLHRHIKSIHSSLRPYKCPECEYSSKVKQVLVAHMLTHSTAKPFSCSICYVKLRDRSSMNRHVKVVHQGQKPIKRYECDYCDYRAVSKSTVIIHTRQHTGERPYHCSECNYSTTSGPVLNMHKLSHSGVKPFKCDLCDYQTYNKYLITRHSKIHSKERPYKCDLCDHTSRTKVTDHKRKHNHENKWKCESCVYSVPSKAALTKHLVNDHVGKVPHKCSICNFRSELKGKLRSHMSTHISNIPVKYRCEGCSYEDMKYPMLVKHMRREHTCLDHS